MKTETKDQLRDTIDMQAMHLNQLRYIIKEIAWMAQRYADNRSSYSTLQFNQALDMAFRLGVIERGSVPYANDGMFGTWNAEFGEFNHDKEEGK